MTDTPAKRSPEPSQAWVLHARSLLQQSADELDGATLSRLNRSRQAALELLDAPPRRSLPWHWIGAAAITAGLALLVGRSLLPTHDTAPMAQAAPSTPAAVRLEAPAAAVAAPDFDLLADPEGLALLEDLEFYAWLEEEQADRGG